MPDLPNEIILQIVESVVPSEPSRVYPPDHPVTRTLIGLSLTSKLTRTVAQRLLFRVCLWIDSNQKLETLLNVGQRFLTAEATARPGPPITLFLAPFPPENLEEPQIVRSVDRLLSSLSGTLRTLIIDMPLRYLYPEDDKQGLRHILRDAFSRLTALEEFCSAQDELFLDVHETEIEPMVWSLWPQLKKLSLYNVCFSIDLVKQILLCPKLTHVVFTRPDGAMDPLPPDVTVALPGPHLQRVLMVDTSRDHARNRSWRRGRDGEADWPTTFEGWLAVSQQTPSPEDWWMEDREKTKSEDGQNTQSILSYTSVPLPPAREVNDIYLCQEWTRNHALDGTLWDFPGTPYQFP